MRITSPFHMIVYGKPGVGKTQLASRFIKEFGGVYCEIAPINQSMGGKGKSPEYTFDNHTQGHSSHVSVDKIGLVVGKDYKYARTWAEWEDIVATAILDASDTDNIIKRFKKDKRMWFVVDDTMDWRTQAANNAATKAGRKQMTQPDWGQATTDMLNEMQNLVSNFNVIYVNRYVDAIKNVKMPDGTVERIATGDRQFYPNQADYRVEAVVRLEVNEDERTYDAYIEKNTIMGILDLPRNFKLNSPEPKEILNTLKLREDFW